MKYCKILGVAMLFSSLMAMEKDDISEKQTIEQLTDNNFAFDRKIVSSCLNLDSLQLSTLKGLCEVCGLLRKQGYVFKELNVSNNHLTKLNCKKLLVLDFAVIRCCNSGVKKLVLPAVIKKNTKLYLSDNNISKITFDQDIKLEEGVYVDLQKNPLRQVIIKKIEQVNNRSAQLSFFKKHNREAVACQKSWIAMIGVPVLLMLVVIGDRCGDSVGLGAYPIETLLFSGSLSYFGWFWCTQRYMDAKDYVIPQIDYDKSEEFAL